MRDGKRKFSSVLIANRGEIACRVMSTLKQLGIRSVAIYHRAEASARHVQLADQCFEITGETPVAAHLDIAQILEIATRAGVDAIHPGYGFLSENAGFAEAVQAAGLTFIGPSADTIRLMGDKIRARQFAKAHDIPVAPSVTPTEDMQAFVAEAHKIGFPLLIKAAAGGGGKGMTIVRSPAELVERAQLASSEANRYFSDPRVYAELYIEQPRHIEVQVVGDGKGGIIHLFERECSIQRRFQKIIEEAPAATLPEPVRRSIIDAALRLTRAARYKNAGTVEFILAQDGSFYFLEMNTRLQVEHPVTEFITGRDLVELQIEVAAGIPLPSQDSITLSGHAIECRICAEDPEQNFMPQVGSVLAMSVPVSPHVRFDTGLVEGQAVTTSFDSMLAKLIVHGQDRSAAIDRMLDALKRTALLGVTTNIDFLARLLDHSHFRDGLLHTGFIDERGGELKAAPLSASEQSLIGIAALQEFPDFQSLAHGVAEPFASMGAWRN